MAFDIALGSPGSGFDINLSSVQNLTQNPSDTVTTSETITREWTIDFKPTDNPVTSEIISKDVSIPFTDNQTTSEDIVKAIGLNPSDTSTTSEELSKAISSVLSDNQTTSEVFEKLFGLQLSDNLTLSETVDKMMDNVLSDMITLSEIFSYQLVAVRYQVIMRQTTDADARVFNKNTTLTHDDVDDNFTNLNVYKIERVISSVASASSIAASFTDSLYEVTALAVDANVAVPSGTPSDGARLVYKLKDNGTARSLTWNAIFRVIGVTLPTVTSPTKPTYVGVVYNDTDSKWDVIAVI